MAIRKSGHSIRIVKSLATAALLTAAVCGAASAEEALTPEMQRCINSTMMGEFIQQRSNKGTESDLDQQARINTTLARIVVSCDIQFSQLPSVGAYMLSMGQAIHRQLERRTR